MDIMDWKALLGLGSSSQTARLFNKVNKKHIPKHIAIIMDGNGRWAKARNLPRETGHRQGVEALRSIIETCVELKVDHLTLFAFSTENWKRPEREIQALMSLLVEYLHKELPELHKNGVKIWALGDIDGLPSNTAQEVRKAIKHTEKNKGLQVNIAINYGSRAEILRAVRNIVEDILGHRLSITELSEDLILCYLYTAGIPDPDLLIRTSGEMRLSNFLLYQAAYTELYFTDKKLLWPDFDKRELLKAILEYQKRVRKYGGIDEQDGG
jgi:undecaprenyl diphosphate synthase